MVWHWSPWVDGAADPDHVCEPDMRTVDMAMTKIDGGQTVVEIRMPPLQDRSKYVVFDYDSRVKCVVAESRNESVAVFEVKKLDGKINTFTTYELINLPGGSEALRYFQAQPSTKKPVPRNSDTTMVFPRRKCKGDHAFLDSSASPLTDDDEYRAPRHAKKHSSTQRQGGKGVLGPDTTTIVTRSKRKSDEAFADSSAGPLIDDNEPRVLRRSGRNSTLQKQKGNAALQYRDESPEALAGESDLNESYEPSQKKTTTRVNRRHTRSAGNTQFAHQGPLVEISEFEDSGRTLRSDQSNEATVHESRRSERAGRQLQNMRVPLEDEIPGAIPQKASQTLKHVRPSEIFKPLPKDDDFRNMHRQTCDSCQEPGDDQVKGRLVFCQGCTLSYHVSCLRPRSARQHRVTKIGEWDYVLQCRRCTEDVPKKEPTASHQSHCQACGESGIACKPFRERKTKGEEQLEREQNDGVDPITHVAPELINNARAVVFRCSRCYRAFHMHHLPSKGESMMDLDVDDENQKAGLCFSAYSITWTCNDCDSAPDKIGGLVAWRPRDPASYKAGTPISQVSGDEKEYLIKWSGKSYSQSTWQPGPWVWAMTHRSMRNAFARKDNGLTPPKMRTEDAIPEEYLRVDIIFEVEYHNEIGTRNEEIDLVRVIDVSSARVKFKGLGYEDVVWEEPPSQEDRERWTDFNAAYVDWVHGHYIHPPSSLTITRCIHRLQALDFETKIMVKEQPESLKGGTLMPYQLEGLNWLLHQWHQEQNAILADEMGLGKTVQIIAFISHLCNKYGCWPFLVVVPNATCANWRREFKKWAPELRVVTYFGSSAARDSTYKHELFSEKEGDLSCHVVVTSYDAAKDQKFQRVFKRIRWAALIVDEGQRLKNDESILYKSLSTMRIHFKILLTGTPLQNNQRELFNLLQFLSESSDAEALEAEFETLTKEKVQKLHKMIRPFFQRRTKAQVLTSLPPMVQIIVPVLMSPLQKELYKDILGKNADLLKAICSGDKKRQVKGGLKNILMELRKCLCHPYVYSLAIEEASQDAHVAHRRLVEASSKFKLLKIMLPKLQERGHRVLIFSQFLDMLTMVEEFLHGQGMIHLRLDGQLDSMEKQKRIDKFNAPDSPVFALLLSTRAGGVGINLATADTVIILDPDFNPHEDLQAISRAHRMGQKNKVLVLQLMTRGFAEERIIQIGKKKMALDHALIEQMYADDSDDKDLESVLRFGAEALFKDGDEHDIHHDSASIDELLNRRQIEDTEPSQDGATESKFSFARVWQNNTVTMDEGLPISDEDRKNDGMAWMDLIERARKAQEETGSKVETFGRGQRKRRPTAYHNRVFDEMEEDDNGLGGSDHDGDFQNRDGSNDDGSDPEYSGEATARKPQEKRNRASKSSFIHPHQHGQPYPFRTKDGYRESDGAKILSLCLACTFEWGPHRVGECPSTTSNVDFCEVCGIAHIGFGTEVACPYLESWEAVDRMLKDLEYPVDMTLKDLGLRPKDRPLVVKSRNILQAVQFSMKIERRDKKAPAAAQGMTSVVQHGQSASIVASGPEGPSMAQLAPPAPHKPMPGPKSIPRYYHPKGSQASSTAPAKNEPVPHNGPGKQEIIDLEAE